MTPDPQTVLIREVEELLAKITLGEWQPSDPPKEFGPWYCVHGRSRGDVEFIAAAPRLVRALVEQLRILQHEQSLIEAATQRGITDCSTPLFQRVRNIVEQLEQADAQLRVVRAERDELQGEFADAKLMLALVKQELGLSDHGVTPLGEIRALKAEKEQAEAQLRTVQAERDELRIGVVSAEEKLARAVAQLDRILADAER